MPDTHDPTTAPAAVTEWWRERRWLRTVAAWVVPLLWLGTCEATKGQTSNEGVIVLLGILVPLLTALAWGIATRPYATAGRASVENGALRVRDEGGSEATEREFDSGLLVPEADGAAKLELSTKKGRTNWFLRFASADDARAALEELGLDAKHRRVFVRKANGWATLGSVVAGLFLGAIAGDVAAGLVLLAQKLVTGHAGQFSDVMGLAMVGEVLGALLLWRRNKPWEVHLGSDGVMVKTGFRSRFYPRERIAQVTRAQQRDQAVLVLELRDGEKIELPQKRMGLDFEEFAALETRLRESMRLGEEGVAVEAAALARNGEKLAEWRARLAGVLDRASGYRTTELDRAALARVLEDAAAGVEARLGAALALTARKDDAEARTMIRVAAEGAADPKVRVALEAIADDREDDAVLEKALAKHASEGAG